MEKEKIDFVIIWVDGNDPEWQKEKAKYSPNKNTDSRNIRYRDWENLKYWFRGVEKFAPWVNKIYFVTWGHVPEWLNINNPKLKIVNHNDFIPNEYLPTFSANPIELNLHRINELSEKFVFFNDDMFIVDNVKETDFFKNGKPCDMAVFNPVIAEDETFISILNNDVKFINRHFNKKEIVKKNLLKYLNIKYKKFNVRTLLCLPWTKILGFYEPHHANSFLKSTYKKVWDTEFELLDETCKHRFRSPMDVNQYIFKYWQYCTGNFIPKKNDKQIYRILENVDLACNAIESQKHKLICLNDCEGKEEFEVAKEKIINSFEKILSSKSSFEK